MQGDKIFLTFVQNSRVVAREVFKFDDTIADVICATSGKRFAFMRRLFYKEYELEKISGKKTLAEIGFGQNAMIELRNKYPRQVLVAYQDTFEEEYPFANCSFTEEELDEMYPSAPTSAFFDEKRTEEEIISVLEKFPRLVSEVKDLTSTIALVAVKTDGHSLKHIPKESQTEAICCAAIMSKPSTISNVKIDMTPKIVDTYLRYRTTPYDFCDQFIKEYIPSQERLLEILEENGLVLKYIKNKTNEICLKAVTENGLALGAVPNDMRTSRICFIAIDNDPKALVTILNRVQTEQQCLLAVQQDPSTIMFVSEKNTTRQVWKTCLEKDPMALNSIRHQTEEICKFAFDLDVNTFKHARVRTPEFCRYAVSRKPSLVTELEGKDDMIRYIAVEADPLVIRLIKNQTEDLIVRALTLDANALAGITIQEERYCYYAMSCDTNAIRHVRNKTYQMCQIAILGAVVETTLCGEITTLWIKSNPLSLRHMIGFQNEYMGLNEVSKRLQPKPGLSCRQEANQRAIAEKNVLGTQAELLLRQEEIENLCLEAVSRDQRALEYVILPTARMTGVSLRS